MTVNLEDLAQLPRDYSMIFLINLVYSLIDINLRDDEIDEMK